MSEYIGIDTGSKTRKATNFTELGRVECEIRNSIVTLVGFYTKRIHIKVKVSKEIRGMALPGIPSGRDSTESVSRFDNLSTIMKYTRVFFG